MTGGIGKEGRSETSTTSIRTHSTTVSSSCLRGLFRQSEIKSYSVTNGKGNILVNRPLLKLFRVGSAFLFSNPNNTVFKNRAIGLIGLGRHLLL